MDLFIYSVFVQSGKVYLVINGSSLMQSLLIIIHYFVVILLTGQMLWFLQLKSLAPQLSLLANPTHSTYPNSSFIPLTQFWGSRIHQTPRGDIRST